MSTHSQKVARIETYVNRAIGMPLAWTLYGLVLAARWAWNAVGCGVTRLSRTKRMSTRIR